MYDVVAALLETLLEECLAIKLACLGVLIVAETRARLAVEAKVAAGSEWCCRTVEARCLDDYRMSQCSSYATFPSVRAASDFGNKTALTS